MNDQLFFKVFDGMLHLGPGSEENTRKALSFTGLQNTYTQCLDIGCGRGAQTLVLAKHLKGTITALDFHQPFLDDLHSSAARESNTAQIVTICMDMQKLSALSESYHLIWSEGAIYNIGFEKGLKVCASLLKKDGIVVFSDMNYRTKNPSAEVKSFWQKEYPGMLNIEENLQLIINTGFSVIHYFKLDKQAHWDNYYAQLEQNNTTFVDNYHLLPKAIELSSSIRSEIDLYKKFHHEYGYTFYIMQLNTNKS